ncbi:MAG: methyltransferase family protein [Pseudonocardia sp.]
MWWRQIKAITPFPFVMTVVIPGVVLATVGRGGGPDLSPWLGGVAIGAGAILLALGLALFCWTVALFARHGKGTLSPFDATTRLVVAGPYRHVRNPMYAGVFSIQIGEALALQSWTLLVWFLCFFTFIATFVPRKEERWLADRYGADYADYRAHVPRWFPRPTPWSPVRG